MTDNLYYAMRECAHLYSAQKTDKPRVRVFTRWDGLDIPPSTRVRVIVVLEHMPDKEITPVLDMAIEFNPT